HALHDKFFRLELDNHTLRYMLDNFILTNQQSQTVQDISKQAGQDIFTILLTTGLMGRDRLEEEMVRYAQRLIDDLVGWKEGSYEFSGDEKSLPQQGVVIKLKPEELVMESMRRNDELSTLKDKLIQSNLVLAKAPNPPSTPLPRECMVIMNLVDGKKTVDEVCHISPMGEYLTYDAISELLGRQMVLVMDRDQASRLKSNRRLELKAFVSSTAMVLLPAAVSFLIGTWAGPALSNSASKSGWLPEQVETNRKVERVRLQKEVHRQLKSLESKNR
ncbi:MAG: DUF4388 domain-containing protein, partial [Candidatus Eisenbacteria bacterium]|nr:DUF4388 domain-containing protein [Candidatus Eisenbacteria bacterium]